MSFALVDLPELFLVIDLYSDTVLQYVLKLLVRVLLWEVLWVRPGNLNCCWGLCNMRELSLMEWILVQQLLILILCCLFSCTLLLSGIRWQLSLLTERVLSLYLTLAWSLRLEQWRGMLNRLFPGFLIRILSALLLILALFPRLRCVSLKWFELLLRLWGFGYNFRSRALLNYSSQLRLDISFVEGLTLLTSTCSPLALETSSLWLLSFQYLRLT